MKTDKTRPVSSFKHDEKRAAIPDSAHQGEEQMAISGQPEQSEYDIFRHEFQRGRDPELYWLGKCVTRLVNNSSRSPTCHFCLFLRKWGTTTC